MITVHFIGGPKDGEVKVIPRYRDEIEVEVIAPISVKDLERSPHNPMRTIYRYRHRVGTEDWICGKPNA